MLRTRSPRRAGALTATAGPPIVPRPARMTAGRSRYLLTGATRIVVPDGSPPALAVAHDLAAYLRPATGTRCR